MHPTGLVGLMGSGQIATDRLGCDRSGKDTAKGDKSNERLHGTFSFHVVKVELQADSDDVGSAPMFCFACIADHPSNLRRSADNRHFAQVRFRENCFPIYLAKAVGWSITASAISSRPAFA
jgi:hypothetical protein